MSDDVFQQILVSTRSAELIGPKTLDMVRASFRGPQRDRWIEALENLTLAKLGQGASVNFALASVAIAPSLGQDIALSIVPTALSVNKSANGAIASLFLRASGELAEFVKDPSSFRIWLRTAEELAALSSDGAELVFQNCRKIFSTLDVYGARAWILNGLRQMSGDRARAIAYFSQNDQASLRPFQRSAEDVLFSEHERRFRAYMSAVWNIDPIIRTITIRPGAKVTRRATFDGPMIRVPEVFSGYRGEEAFSHYRAVLAHIGAHMTFSGAQFPKGGLRPIQMALVGLIEDARVEHLAMKEFPGLKRLWQRYHQARVGSAHTAEILMARLAYALMNEMHEDDDPLVRKGRAMFFDSRSEWDNPAMSRSIGNLLGNDIGQMRLQFNAKTYVVEPSYRDDNIGLWDFGDPPPEQSEEAETIMESVRITEKNEENKPEKRDSDPANDTPANRAARMQALPDDQGFPIARHPEWDHVVGSMRNDWTTAVEYRAHPGATDMIDMILHNHADVRARISRLVGAAKVSRPMREKRQPQGDRLDLDASVRAAIDLRMGQMPDLRIFETQVMRARDLSVLVLLDVSESTRDPVKGSQTSVLNLERASAALLAEALSGLGDPFAIHAFCSNGREDVHYIRVKDFNEPHSPLVKARLAGLRGQLSTRLGAALRQSALEIRGQPTHRKLILLVTDGEPADIDVVDERYLVEDARKAVHDLGHLGIDVFCVALDNGGETYLPRIFGRRNFVVIDKIEALPERLPMLYLRLAV